jgi:hypothetical protein
MLSGYTFFTLTSTGRRLSPTRAEATADNPGRARLRDDRDFGLESAALRPMAANQKCSTRTGQETPGSLGIGSKSLRQLAIELRKANVRERRPFI